MLLTKAGDVESNPGPTTHTNKHTPVIWICDLCYKQTNKKQTSIRCKYTKIKQGQYKPDWRCTIHTPTQNVTITPSTAHQKQTTTHPLTNNNQPKDKNIVILQININGIRNKIKELKNSYTAPNRTSSQYKKQNSHRKLKHQKYPTTPPYAQTDSTNNEGAHHTDQGRHNLHKHKHTHGHQDTQHRTTTGQNTRRQDQRHHSSKHILSTKRHHVTTLQYRGHRHRILYTTSHQHTRLNTHR